MRKIAIILGRDFQFDDGDYNTMTTRIAESVTDWVEVTDEEYELLKKAQNYDYHARFTLIERPKDELAYIKKTVADYLKWAQKIEDQRLAEKKKAEEASLARKMKKEAKTKADKLKLLEKLKQELGEQ